MLCVCTNTGITYLKWWSTTWCPKHPILAITGQNPGWFLDLHVNWNRINNFRPTDTAGEACCTAGRIFLSCDKCNTLNLPIHYILVLPAVLRCHVYNQSGSRWTVTVSLRMEDQSVGCIPNKVNIVNSHQGGGWETGLPYLNSNIA